MGYNLLLWVIFCSVHLVGLYGLAADGCVARMMWCKRSFRTYVSLAGDLVIVRIDFFIMRKRIKKDFFCVSFY